MTFPFFDEGGDGDDDDGQRIFQIGPGTWSSPPGFQYHVQGLPFITSTPCDSVSSGSDLSVRIHDQRKHCEHRGDDPKHGIYAVMEGATSLA